MENVCRGCLATNRKMIKATLFETVYKDLMGIITSPDNLPQMLCYECAALMQKYVKFRNKVMKSHKIITQYVQNDVKSTNCEKGPLLIQTSIMHIDIPSNLTELMEGQSITTDVGEVDMPVITKIESIEVKEESLNPDYEEGIIAEQWREEIPLTRMTSEPKALDARHEVTSTQQRTKPKFDEKHLQNDVPKPSEIKLLSTQVMLKNSNIEMKSAHESRREWQHLDEHGYVRNWKSGLRNKETIDKTTTQNKETSPLSNIPATTPNNKEALTNIDSDDGLKTYTCGKCYEIFNHKMLLNAHIITHSDERTFKYFTDKITLRKHSGLHPKPTAYQCDICSKTYQYKSYLSDHLRSHFNTKLYKCSECPKYFKLKTNHDKHIVSHCSQEQYICEKCGKSFSNKGFFRRHVQKHEVNNSSQCKVCTKTFKYNSQLIRHNTIHTGEKPYKCPKCNKGFSFKGHLNIHYRIHTGEKPFKCEHCLKMFSSKNILLKHVSMHSDKPNKCDLCNKCFKNKSYLKKHIRVHLPYMWHDV